MIRKIKNEDYKNLKLIIKEQFDVDYKEDTPFCNWLIYEENDEIIGFINYDIIYEKSELEYIYVKEEYRRKNIASSLFNEMIENLKVKKVDSITLEVNVKNKVAISFYEKYGFKIVSIRKNYYKNNDAYLMLKSW